MRTVLAAVLVLSSLPAQAACNDKLITFVSWTLKPLNEHDNEMTTLLKSNATKPIREISAIAGFKELDGSEIGRFELYPYLRFEPGEEVTDTALWGPYTFESLLTRKHEEIVTFACVNSVTYADGSKEAFE